MKISLIIPLFDPRNTGWTPLESALHQATDRQHVEVIAVTGRVGAGELPPDAKAAALLRRCDAIVHVDADPCHADQEIPLLLAGYGKSTGEVLFFMEGHTVLEPDCCTVIATHFRENPQSLVAWAPRIHRSESPLGTLIGIHSKHHESLAIGRGGFWLGANSVIARSLFERMGRLDPAYMRFAERVLFERVVREKIAIGKLGKPLATHHDDMPLAQLKCIAAAAGEAKFRYYNLPISGTGSNAAQVRHWIYPCANRAAIALLLFPLSRLLAEGLLRGAVGVFGISRAWAYRLFVPGFGFADLSGYCKARIRAARVRNSRRESAADGGAAIAAVASLEAGRTRG